MLSFLALCLLRQDSRQSLLKRMQDAVRFGDQSAAVALFRDKKDADYLLRMALRVGGLKNLKVAVFPAPQGWEDTGKYWATFHTWQEIEQDHDPIYRVVDSPQGMELGEEIPEWDCAGVVKATGAKVWLYPKDGIAEVAAGVQVGDTSPSRSLLFRLNDSYSFEPLREVAGHPFFSRNLVQIGPLPFHMETLDENAVASQAPASFRVGSLLAFKPISNLHELGFHYRAYLGDGAAYSSERDQVTQHMAYVTSFWVPSLGRLPAPRDVVVDAPADWVVRSEGNLVKTEPGATGYVEREFKCDIPISYPKICAGKYVLGAEGEQNGVDLRSYQFAPIDKTRANKDLDWMKRAIAFYDQNLGPFPFKEYDCFDGKNYYGIESYSYTILDPTITTWAVSHEMGHTYFGGLVPCAYVKDSWNEGVTQYVDDVLLHGNAREVNDNAMKGLNVSVPLTQMPVAWEYNGATYWRGAYAMEMLDQEIGHEKVMQALRDMIKDREGKETTWPDLRQYFEKTSGEDLKWFWINGLPDQAFLT